MNLQQKKRIAAIDYGTKRLGLAWTDPLGLFAQPAGTFARDELLAKLNTLVQADEIGTILVGYPLNEDETQNAMTEVVDLFINDLHIAFPFVPVERVNEHRSSREAMRILAASGISRKERKKKGRLDSAAACIILQEYLDSQR
ncbi:MAG: Holliday junction resolvase RuvX [Chlorobium sp.]|jgi:putative Holliday junction resolvase|uniref:Holliday junction resolvase RuvX n=1 Tax=Chlorobium sp. TaxID=1095 RepID=UPI001DD7907A|nr:Holliday junction resolvase RuvX [Chlorobium sp.]MBN1278540.1 Holliday junction resolvase RuvX [Chlorobiaceae bacterium]MCF8215554.1 Holliday junction resolvase RuvX [Chlorobium sp.]MCF8270392.1 Holliday junction resolvase RuvX [Chlorobium sp.]MCF8286761.1 Holliday junction resolvase RuvX [Chlorobium sp.]MCF8290283.1 Holliday junction resolvase RuvX [Chlorobium sp.]